MKTLMLAILGAVFLGPPALAMERLDGYFIALKRCEAYQSKNRLTNPGNIETEPMRAYEMIAINKAGGDFFQMRFPGAPVTPQRWVHVSCGEHVVRADTEVDDGPVADGGDVKPSPGEESKENLLALSWQPAFCETRPVKVECQDLNAGHLPITEQQLSIHGLWPQPRGNDYCGVSASLKNLDKARRWGKLPEVEMDDDTRDALAVAMPGAASFLERHEWIKHGTCYRGAGGSDEYYDDTLRLVEEINTSAVGEFLASHVGAEVSMADVRDRFDEAFGADAGKRVQFKCSGDGRRTLLQELQINLRGTIGPTTPLSELLLAADERPIGCARGVIDPAGLQ